MAASFDGVVVAELRGHELVRRATAARVTIRPTLAFVAAFALLSAVLCVRYPAPEPRGWYLSPSIDVSLLLALFTVLAWRGIRLPALARMALVAAFLVVRFLRLGDGIAERFLFRDFTLYVDLPLLPELVRLYFSTVPVFQFVLSLLALLAWIAAIAWAVERALAFCEVYLAKPRQVAVFGGMVAVCAVLSPFVSADPRRLGAFGASALPRVWREVAFVANANEYRRSMLERIARVERELARSPANLSKLERASVYLFLIESYGQTVFELPVYERRIRAAHSGFETELGKRGFSMASSLLESPAYGGGSWLAHATLATGVMVHNQFEYEILCRAKPKALARFFREAGYRTILVQPATTRSFPEGDFYGFDRKYFAWNFDYRGPAFAWAPMPDQYVLDFVRRSEKGFSQTPMFVEYMLVSSHAPWSRQPPLVGDWSKLRNGAIYWELDMVRYPVSWSDLSEASSAYIHSLEYDFEVLRRYVAEFVADPSLVIILGDHQPPAELTGQSASRGVPVHVLSRRSALVDAFLARGYIRGMRPDVTKSRPGMDRFLPSLLEVFSTSLGSDGGKR